MKKATELMLQLNELTNNVYTILREHIEDSRYTSKFNGEKAIKVDLFDYKELCIVHDKLTFLDNYGNEHSIDSEATLEDLIEIIDLVELDDMICSQHNSQFKSEYKD